MNIQKAVCYLDIEDKLKSLQDTVAERVITVKYTISELNS